MNCVSEECTHRALYSVVSDTSLNFFIAWSTGSVTKAGRIYLYWLCSVDLSLRKLNISPSVTEMNRHHYALFVRNCRLILLLRRDFGEGDLNIFRPAEWRWKIPEVLYSLKTTIINHLLFRDFGRPTISSDLLSAECIITISRQQSIIFFCSITINIHQSSQKISCSYVGSMMTVIMNHYHSAWSCSLCIHFHYLFPSQVCDDEWHHYAINVRFPNVELFIDGEPFHSTDGKDPEVIDDWPLHPAHGVNTTMVVGACWQGIRG